MISPSLPCRGQSGSLDDSEFIELAEKLHIKMGLKKLRKEFATMDSVGVGTIPCVL